MRFWLNEETRAPTERAPLTAKSLVGLAKRNRAVLIRGYTHLQRAQPVFFAHHLLAYVEMFDRDRSRLQDCGTRITISPLGSGALAERPLPLDREFVARELGFVDEEGRPRVTRNSMDAVSDRDFVVEFFAPMPRLSQSTSAVWQKI